MIVFPPAWVAAVTAGTKSLGAAVAAASKFSAEHLKIEDDLILMVLWFVDPESLSGNLVPCKNVFSVAIVI